MTLFKTIPVEQLGELDVQEGDTLHIVSLQNAKAVVEITRLEPEQVVVPGLASAWIASARGSVRDISSFWIDNLKMEYYRAKHDLRD